MRLADGADPDSLRDDLRSSLGVIAPRAEPRDRFMTGYTMLARLPAPRRRNVRLRTLVEQAADAVVDMKPGIVYPYRYRGQAGFSDAERFEQLVKSEDTDIEVRQLDWYPGD